MTVTPWKACPSEEVLRRMLQGLLDPPQSDWLDQHVEHCLNCQSRLDELTRAEWLGPNVLPSLPEHTGAVAPDEAAFIRRMIRELPPPGGSLDSADDTVPVTPLCQIPGFEHLQLVAQGGSGEVYRGWQPELNRWVALKTLPPTRSPERKARVIREARLLGRLQHPHIVRIYSVGELQGQPYLVMEWIRGGSLQDRIRQGPLPIREAARLVWEVATALEVVHAAGIVHRDLKPANVLLEPIHPTGDASGQEPDVAKLTDFSIAFDTDEHERLSQTGMVLGTPGYMAPEQTGLSNQPAAVGPLADIYGAGAVLYALLTGRVPHEGVTSLAVLRRVATTEPVAPRTLRREIPRDLETIVQKCLRTDPQRRYRSAGDLADDLRRYLDGRPILARPYSPGERLWIWGRRHGAALLGMTLLGTAGILTAVVGGSYQRERDQLVTALSQASEEAEQASATAELSLRESRDSRWKVIEQLILKAEVQLREEVLAPEQERALVETIRRHLQNQVVDSQLLDERFAQDQAGTIDRWTSVEEQHNFPSQAIADGQLLDRLRAALPDNQKTQSLFLSRDLRTIQLLDRLRRFSEADALLETVLARELSDGVGGHVAGVMPLMARHARALQEAGESADACRWVRRGVELMPTASVLECDDLPLAVTQLELRLLELELQTEDLPLDTAVSRENEWLMMLREVFGRQARRNGGGSQETVRSAQHLVELTGPARPRLNDAALEVWQQAIGRLNSETHAAEQVVQRLAWETEASRLAGSPGGAVIVPTDAESLGLTRAFQFLDQYPDDHATRQRVAEVLVRQARLQQERTPLRAVNAARRAVEVLTPSSGEWRIASGSRSILTDAYQQQATGLRALGRLEECRQALELALSHSRYVQSDPLLLELLRVHLALGQPGAANEIFQRIKHTAPQWKQARELIEQAGMQP